MYRQGNRNRKKCISYIKRDCSARRILPSLRFESPVRSIPLLFIDHLPDINCDCGLPQGGYADGNNVVQPEVLVAAGLKRDMVQDLSVWLSWASDMYKDVCAVIGMQLIASIGSKCAVRVNGPPICPDIHNFAW